MKRINNLNIFMEPKKIYVSKDSTAVLLCPHCGETKKVSVSQFKEKKHTIKIKCVCEQVYSVNLEFRKIFRKKVRLYGSYAKLYAKNPKDTFKGKRNDAIEQGNIIVKDIAKNGIGILTLETHSLKTGDELKVKFALDDSIKTEIEIKVIVKWVKDNLVGCEIIDSQQDSRKLGFYLLS